MNKFTFLKICFLFMLFSCCSLMAHQECCPERCFTTTLELRSDAFFHSFKRFRHIYGDVSASYQVEGSIQCDQNMALWTNFDWFSKHGRSIGFRDPTRVDIANISFGIKIPYCITRNIIAYVGIGPSLSRIWVNNRLFRHRHEEVSKPALGGIIKGGVNYFITEHIFFDVFVDYLYQPVYFEKFVNIGGVKIGGGIGIKL